MDFDDKPTIFSLKSKLDEIMVEAISQIPDIDLDSDIQSDSEVFNLKINYRLLRVMQHPSAPYSCGEALQFHQNCR